MRFASAGSSSFARKLRGSSPFLRDRVGELRDWNDVSLLTVKVDRLKRWFRPGLLCIGDAAHAMSPVGGVGINLAIQDAVAAANILAAKLAPERVSDGDLEHVQRRREFPTRATQKLQVVVQNRVIRRVLASSSPLHFPGVATDCNDCHSCAAFPRGRSWEWVSVRSIFERPTALAMHDEYFVPSIPFGAMLLSLP